jgi:hypothetical protein
MASEATIAASNAILKTKYANGVEKTHFQQFKFFASVKKREDFTGDNKVFALQDEDPQGAGAVFTDMIGVMEQGSYRRFTVTPVNFYSAARVRGDALNRAKDAGALVNLWENETQGAKNNNIRYHEIYCLGNGTGVLGTIDGASNVATTTVTLQDPSQAVNFSKGASYSLVDSSTSLTPTLRDSGKAIKLTKINRRTGVLTFEAALNTISGAQNTDSFVLKSTSAVGGVPRIHTGMRQWVDGSDTPPDLFGYVRSTDPVRSAGQKLDGTGTGMEEALIEAESLLDAQGFLSGELVAWCNPYDIAELKKSQVSRVSFFKDAQLRSSIASLSFKAFEMDGIMGKIKLMSNAFQPRGEVLMVDMSDIYFESAGPAPHLQNYDGQRVVRIPTDDVYQVSFGSYGQLFDYKPFRGVRVVNWGAE